MGRLDGETAGVVSTGAIVFSSRTADEGYELYTVDLRGAVMRLTADSPLTDDFYEWATPKWSPNGRSIAVLDRARLNALGIAPKLVGVPLLSPSWAPSGRQIVGERPDYGYIATFNLSTRKSAVLYDDYKAPGIPTPPQAIDPDWSPKGDLIAVALEQFNYDGDVTVGSGIGLLNAYSRAEYYRRFVPSPLASFASLRDVRRPEWSPDARQIVFDARGKAQPASAPPSIYVVAIGSTRPPRRIVRDGNSPSWSPDGKKIVFARNVTKTNSEIFVANADGTGVRRLTTKPGNDTDPDWRPPPSR